ncbi:MAG: cytidylate kinase-like family protein [Prevotella sp.]|jgi:cytidylate kinase|nr:cytidylate kinase-like family protein [Prevotella sp.]
MNKNEKFVITINRELGSGGRTVGEKLAEKLGVSFYDKAVIMGLEEKYHLTVDEIEKMRNKKHHWWSDFKLVTGIGEGLVSSSRLISETGKEPEVLTTETMFKAESEILEDIANVESCVIAGRSGFYVFRNHPNHLRVMIQASLPFRIKRLVRKKGITEEEARKIIEKVDKMRENYVKKFTGTTRYDTRNYDIVISADGKTEDQIVDQILLYIEQ